MASFTPPDVSAALCENVPFESASDTAIGNKAAFDAFDQTPEAKTIRVDARPCSHFPMELDPVMWFLLGEKLSKCPTEPPLYGSKKSRCCDPF